MIISATPETQEVQDSPDLAVATELRALIFCQAQYGQRLDRALVDLVPEFSRSYLQQLIQLGAVCINGQVCNKPSAKIKFSDQGRIELRPTAQSQAFQAEQIPLQIVYEDDDLRVINKPAGLVVHPAPGNWSGTLMNALLGLDARAFDLPRAGIVHRLDKDTSGLMVVARTRCAMDALVRMIAARQVKRDYLALGQRAWHGARLREVQASIGRDPANRLRMAVVDLAKQSGKTASTSFELLASCNSGCFVKCTLKTGRTHQIRVHMASIGHPLVGDLVYGGTATAGLRRQALHAYKLSFVHPVRAQTLKFSAPMPIDMAAALQQWGITYNENTL